MPSTFKQISGILKIKSGMKKNYCTKINNKPPCILFMNSHLILSLKPTRTTFLSQIFGGRLYMEIWGSLVLPRYCNWDIIKTRQASHVLTETRQKGHQKIMFHGGGRENTHFLDRWTCANGKGRHKWSPCYRIAHGWKDEYGSWSWNPFEISKCS
jgi:hypothetical protein